MNEQCYRHGAVFKVCREDTEETIKENLSQMKRAGFNTVVVWPAAFWWEEKKEGYPYNTGRYILKIAEELQIDVIMELAGQITCMEYMPDFLMKDEYFARKSDGSIEFGQPSFGFLNYFHPEVSAIIKESFQKTAAAYKDFKALLAYDIFNETMFRSFDEYTMEEFRRWLKEKYGTIENLNRVWERTYRDFSQVSYTEWKWLSVMPQADWLSFKKAAIKRFLDGWCSAVRAVDSKHPLIADNIFSGATPAGSYDRPQDDFSLQETVDIIGMSFYPKSVHGVMEPQLRHEVYSGFYAASKYKGFLISEMQTHLQALFNPTTAVSPKELELWCYEGIAGGATGLIYWMWRPFSKGLQTLGRGLVDYKNRPTERLEAAKRLSEFFKNTPPLHPQKAKVAVVYDRFCEDLQKTYTMAYDVDNNFYVNAIYGAYKAFFDAGIPCDIVELSEIDRYETVVLCNHLSLGKAAAEKLCQFVKAGGNVVIDGKTGVVDEEALALKNIPGGDFSPFVGEDYLDSDDKDPTFTVGDLAVDGYYHRDLVEVSQDALVEATFSDGAAAVVSTCNGGTVLTVNTQLFYGYFMKNSKSVVEYIKTLGRRFGLFLYELSDGLSCKLLKSDNESFAFIFNYSDTAKKGTFRALDGYTFEIEVAAEGVKVLRWTPKEGKNA